MNTRSSIIIDEFTTIIPSSANATTVINIPHIKKDTPAKRLLSSHILSFFTLQAVLKPNTAFLFVFGIRFPITIIVIPSSTNIQEVNPSGITLTGFTADFTADEILAS